MNYDFLDRLGIKKTNSGVSFGDGFLEKTSGGTIPSINPSNEEVIAEVMMAGPDDYELVKEKAIEGFKKWRKLPVPARGLIVKEIVREIERQKNDLGALISLEMGKILPEGRGEVQEIIDVADTAIGYSRQAIGGGPIKPSERPNHFMFEIWEPLGVTGIITAFNFPMAVWGWNACIALPCGNPTIWKPSLQTPLCAIALQYICNRVFKKHGLEGISNLVIGDDDVVGERLIQDEGVPLISFTGSTKVGRRVNMAVAERLAPPPILELGGNNAAIVLKDANLDLALQAIFFGFIGTSAQRCTSTRRLYIHEDIFMDFVKKLVRACKKAVIGPPMNPDTIMGPVVSKKTIMNVQEAVSRAKFMGAMAMLEGRALDDRKGFYMEPAIVVTDTHLPIMDEETFGPLLFVQPIRDLDDGIEQNNRVPYGLSSCLFTEDITSAFKFLSAEGSDCGIRNVNCGNSGAETSCEFGGNKHTGWGREAGGGAWKRYMRHSANVINWSGKITLSQGIEFFSAEGKLASDGKD